MADPRIYQFAVDGQGLLHSLANIIFANRLVNLLCTLSRCHHVDDSIIPPVPKLYIWTSHLVKYPLPYILVCVSSPIHYASIEKYDSMTIRLVCELNENVLKWNL